MSNESPEHRDRLDRVLSVGDYVAYPYFNTLELGKIDKLNKKMVRIQGKVNKYSKDTVKLDGPELVIYLLKK